MLRPSRLSAVSVVSVLALVSTLTASASLAAPADPATEQVRVNAKQAVERATQPRAAASLIRMHQYRDEIDDLSILAAGYQSVLERRSTNPFVRTTARLTFLDLERARGRMGRTTELMRDL